MDLDINIIKGDAGSYRVILAGRLDNATAPLLNKQLADVVVDPGTKILRLEISGLTYISSSGLGALAVARNAVTARGGAMVVIGAQPAIAKVLEIVRMLPKESLCGTPEAADAYLTALQNAPTPPIK